MNETSEPDMVCQSQAGVLTKRAYLASACCCGALDPGPDPTWYAGEIPPDEPRDPEPAGDERSKT